MTLQGPLMSLPFTERVGDGQTPHEVRCHAYIRPERLAADVALTVTERRRGIYTTPVYTTRLKREVRFARLTPNVLGEGDIHIDAGRTRLLFRSPGLTGETLRTTKLIVDGSEAALQADPGAQTLDAALPAGIDAGRGFDFAVELELSGTRT